MDLSGVKMVVTDMDGTLLNSKHEVSELFFEQFEAIKANNIQFVAASGRQYHSILEKLKPIEKHITIVAENGAYIVKNGIELLVNAIPVNEIIQLLKSCEPIPNVHVVLCGKKKAYIKPSPQLFENTIAEYYTSYEIINNFEEIPEDDFFKVALCHYDGSEENILPHLSDLDTKWHLKVSGKLWIDISMPSSHKGNAITQLQQKFNITPEETMVFGDYNNDLEMLSKAKYSFAMANAHPEVKRIANFETISNDENGVEHILDMLLSSIENNQIS